MATLKTKETDASVDAYLDAIDDVERRADCRSLVAMMQKASGCEPRMWGESMVGFGSYHYRYASGHEGDAMRIGFASRTAALTVYVMPGLARYPTLLARLGKHRSAKSCLHLKRLADVDREVLDELLATVFADMKQLHGSGI